ncbi:MAG TPA: VPLPA-CTERM sorting domain-containing protein [Gammaproteobacteria bacterium]|nr:VPLPA-CTERM sorting domain-containing protein [Gammaproteobacteria bacterium]
MRRPFETLAAAAALMVFSALAQAVPSIEVNGRASAALAPPAPSAQSDFEEGAPLARTSVSVGDEAPGAWKYFALSDITTPKLQVFGALDNSAGANLGDGEIALLVSNATLSDTLSIAAPSSDPYLVTAEMVIDGILQGSGSNARVNALLTISPTGALSQTQSKFYSGDVTVVDDVLPITRQFVGNAEFELSSALFFFVSHVDAGAKVLADFSHTAIINLSVTTLAGDPISNVTITSESGQFGIAPVPLPAALPLMLGGLAGLALRARQRRV